MGSGWSKERSLQNKIPGVCVSQKASWPPVLETSTETAQLTVLRSPSQDLETEIVV